jgi:hypothetical protein
MDTNLVPAERIKIKMDKNIHEFNSPLHRRLYYQSAALIPIEKSTEWIKDKELKESCYQFYNYISNAFDDILEHPAENYIDPFDPAFDDIYHIDSAIIGNIIFHKSIIGIFLMAAYDAKDDCIEIENNDYDKLIKNTRSKYNKHVKNCGLKLNYTFNDLLLNLSRRGILITRTENQTIISNTIYPKMFLSAKLLYDACEVFNKKMKRGSQWFINLDFRAIENALRKVELDDIFSPLTPHEKVLADELYEFAVQKNLQFKYENLSGIRNASFTYRKSHIMSFLWRDRYGLRIRITLPEPETVEHDLLLKKINELENAENIKDFCLVNLFGCLFCNTGCVKSMAYKKQWIILGRPAPKLIASCWGFGLFLPPDKENIVMVKTLVDILTNIY